jgi:plasmid stabilization system protein ParE
MKFTVTWVPAAERELARLWTVQADRGAITAAADTIDAMLRTDPEKLGESREDSIRVLSVAPLTVYFRVLPEDRIAQVAAVRYVVGHN